MQSMRLEDLNGFHPPHVPVSAVDRGIPGVLLGPVAGRVDVQVRAPRFDTRREVVWLLHGAADNHGNITIRDGKSKIAELNNLLQQRHQQPQLWLTKIDWDPDRLGLSSEWSVRFDSIHAPFFSEMFAWIVAPKNQSMEVFASQIINPLLGRSNWILPFAFSIVFLLVVGRPYLRTGGRVAVTVAALIMLCGAIVYLVLRVVKYQHDPVWRTVVGIVEASHVRTSSRHGLLIAVSSELSQEAREGDLRVRSFSTQQEFLVSRPSQGVLWGAIAWVQDLPASLYFKIWGSLLALTLVLIFTSGAGASSWAGSSIVALNVFQCLRLSEGFDELYLNLRHSFNLKQSLVFSANSEAHIEATADFLPFFLVGLVGRVASFNLDSLALVVSLLGNMLTLVSIFLISSAQLKLSGLDRHGVASIKRLSLEIMLLGALFPPLSYVGASGFMASVFTAHIFAVLYFYFWTPRRWLGLALAGALTLVRFEGVFFAGLILILEFLRARRSKFSGHMAWVLGVLLLPFVCSCIVRSVYFGSAIPNPVIFKSAGFDRGYLAAGLSGYLHAAKLFLLVPFAGAVIMLGVVARPAFQLVDLGKLSLGLGMLAVFTMSYAVGGGDWFPWYWNRYQLPFTLYCTVVAWLLISMILLRASGVSPRLVAMLVIGFWLAIVFQGYNPQAYRANPDNAYQFTLGHFSDPFPRWGRVDNLSSFGYLMRQSSEPKDRLASSELATMMYFANRPIFDLLGTASTEIARRPLEPWNPGALFFRKRDPHLIDRHKPEIIALNDPALPLSATEHISVDRLGELISTRFFAEPLNSLAYYRVGEYQRLVELGYQPLAVEFRNFIFVYWVHSSIIVRHLEALKKYAVSEGSAVMVSAHPSKELLNRFPD